MILTDIPFGKTMALSALFIKRTNTIVIKQWCSKRRYGYRPSIALLVCLFFIGQVWANENTSSIGPDFNSRFEKAVAEKNVSALNKLAVEYPGKLRQLINEVLSEYSAALAQSRPRDAERLSDLATAAATLFKEIFGEPFSATQIRLYRSWKPGQHLSKMKADSFLKTAKTAFDEGRYGDVAAPGRSALEIYTTLRDKVGRMKVLHYLGQAERKLANYSEALSWHHLALNLARGVSDPWYRGLVLIDIGDVHERKKEGQEAQKFYRQALQLLKSPADWQGAALALRQLGDVYVATGNFQRAFSAYHQALEEAEKGKDVQYIAEFCDYLGFCHRRLGDSLTAISYHRKALESEKRIASADIARRAQARSLNHLGLCTAELAKEDLAEGNPELAVEKYRLAIAYEEEALELALNVSDRWRQGYVLRALSLMYREWGLIAKKSESLNYFQRSLKHANAALELALEMKEKEWQGLAQHHRGLALYHLGRGQEALQTFQQALGLWEQMGDLQSAGYAHHVIARQFHEAQGKWVEADAAYDRAIGAFEKIGDIESQGFTLMDKARVQGLLGGKEEAAALYDRGISKLEIVRTKAGFSEFRKAFMSKIYHRYEEAALFAIANGFNHRALVYVESMKARAFLDQLAEGPIEVEKGIDPKLKAKQERLENTLSAETDKISEELRKPSPDTSVLSSLRAKVEQLAIELNRLVKQIRLRNPHYASVRYPLPVTAAELQTKVLSKTEVLLEYFVTSQGVFCFVVTKEHFEVVKLTVEEPELKRMVEALLKNIRPGYVRGETYDRKLAARLYDLLLKPFEKKMEGKTLIIVPDNMLTRMPFEALVIIKEGTRSYLIEKHEVKYIQSASVLAHMVRHGATIRPSEGFVGFGDPVYDYENFKKGQKESDGQVGERGGIVAAKMRQAMSGQKLSRLEASGEEVRAIERIFKEKKIKGKTFFRAEAKEENAKGGAMRQYGYIHFSMHGLITPKLQALIFSQIQDSKDDGLLTVNEIMNLRYHARLIVLSACQTGLGKQERGEGISGLTRAVLYAGTAATVVSLWNVDDDGTKELMQRLYKHLIQKKETIGEALRRAKQELLETEYGHPFFWAPFVMYGR
jgi:CHAT domain-containing protein/tetratricopeptide (TPR) repeat protein